MRPRRNELHRINLDNGDHYKNDYPKGFVKVDIPEGKSGDWQVQRFTLTKDDVGLQNLRLIRDGMWRRIVPPGTYTRLVCGRDTVMSDTPAEAIEHQHLYARATGSVLLNGLGLGFALKALLTKPDVLHVTVIENSPDVIKLVKPSITDKRVTIIEADALEWRPARGVKFNVVWHDIWNDICEDNKAEMEKLKRSYARRTKWQACWSAEYL